MSNSRGSPSEVAAAVHKRIPLRKLVGEYSYKRRLQCDESATFNVASRQFQKAGCLTQKELHEIARWKSPRSADRVLRNDDQVVKKFTQAAISLANTKLPVSVPISLLTILEGVRVPMASTILTVWDPKRFGIIDVNAWSALFPKRRLRQFEPRDYDEYVSILKELRRLTRLTARQIDMALWTWWDQKKKRARR